MTVGINAYTPSYTGFTPKPAGSSASDVSARPTRAGDSAKIGDLAQALTGKAAALFHHMDAKTRGTLETMVRSGQVTAKDVVIGLDEMAKQAEFGRFIKENPLTEAEKSRGAELQAMRDKLPFGQAATNSSTRPQSTAREMDSLQKAYETGQITQDELDKRLEAVRAQMQEEIDTRLKPQMERLNTYGAAAAEQMNSVLGRKVSEYKAALADRLPNGAAEEISTEEGREAANKLYSHGLLGVGPKAIRQATEAYARQADVAGLGPAEGVVQRDVTSTPMAAENQQSMSPPPAATAQNAASDARPAASKAETGIPDWTAALLPPRQQAGIELLRQAMEGDEADKPREEKGFWATKYLLSSFGKN